MSGDGQAAGPGFGDATRAVMPQVETTRLLLLRHGEVAGFEQRLVRGQIDLALSERGLRQHDQLADWIERTGRAPDLVFTSDLARCRDLAERVAARSGSAPRVEPVPALREQALGAWEGRAWDEVSHSEGAAINAYWDDYLHAVPPGGESMHAMMERVTAWWRAELPRWSGRNVALVTHVGPLRALLCAMLGVAPAEALRFAPAIASCTEVLWSAPGAVLETFGERPWMFAEASTRRAAAGTRGPDRSGVRIALSGSAGTGKTTLARALAEALELPYVEEGMRRRLEAGLDLHRLDPRGLADLVRELWREQRHAEERAAASSGGFVSDRSHADFAAFWLHYGLVEDRTATDAFLAETRAAAESGGLVVLVPHGALPLVDDGVRSTEPWIQLRFQLIVEGLHERWIAPDRLLRAPAAADPAQRLAAVLAQIRARSST